MEMLISFYAFYFSGFNYEDNYAIHYYDNICALFSVRSSPF